MSKVVETRDGVYINGHLVPFVLCKDDGSSTTRIEHDGEFVKVTITFLARSYKTSNRHKCKYDYKFKRSKSKILFSKLNKIKRELSHIKGSLFS